jgi:hypothetical protein
MKKNKDKNLNPENSILISSEKKTRKKIKIDDEYSSSI